MKTTVFNDKILGNGLYAILVNGQEARTQTKQAEVTVSIKKYIDL